MPDVLTTASDPRPRLLVLMTSAMYLRDFTDCGALARLAERFQLDFAYTEDGPKRQLSAYGHVRYRHGSPGPRSWLWDVAWIIIQRQRYRRLIQDMNRRFHNRKTSGKFYWPMSQRVGTLLFVLGLGPIVSAAIKWLLDRTSFIALHADRKAGYAAVIVPTVLRDLAAEDVIRWARSARVPSVAVQGNWDCFNLKTMVTAPDYMLTWGEQSWYFARLLQELQHTSLRVIGSQRHDHYFEGLPDKNSARRQLQLSLDRPILLFCGSLSPFDEQAALRELNTAISDGRLPENLLILYKPHPNTTPDKKADEFDRQQYKHVQLIAFRGLDVWNALDEYPVLFRAVDATMSPYSTMGLESALCGRPTLCLGYHPDPGLPYWKHAHQYLHLQSYRYSPWAVCCDRQDQFIGSVRRLLELAADPCIERIAIESTRHVVYRDELPYDKRLCRAIDGIIGTVRAGLVGLKPLTSRASIRDA